MILILVGPPASGKGTYAELLAKKLKLPHVSMGELLRQLAEKTDYGKELKEKYWGKGILVPDDITLDVLQQGFDKKRGAILDGFPRNLNQAKLLDGLVKVSLVISLKVSDKTIVKRISGRLQCKVCGAIYNKYTEQRPRRDELCDKDGSKLYARPDDKNVGAIKERIKIYKKDTTPVIAHYKRQGIVKEIDGEPQVDVVFKSVLKTIGKR